MKKLLFILIVCCSLNGFGQDDTKKNADLYYTGRTKIRMEKDGRIDIMLVNINSGRLYDAKYWIRFKVIENLPEGTYKFHSLYIGGETFICYEDDYKYITEYFGEISTVGGKTYFLGDINAVKNIKEKTLEITVDNELPKRLVKKLKRKGVISSEDDIKLVLKRKEESLVIKY